jgi:hypothetical protein
MNEGFVFKTLLIRVLSTRNHLKWPFQRFAICIYQSKKMFTLGR